MTDTYDIDPKAFWHDPHPDLAKMQAMAPVIKVPQLGATLLTRRDDVFEQEKRIEVFSSQQPGGLMTTLMGENMMRKDGDAHMAERKALFPALSPRVVKDTWTVQFQAATDAILDQLEDRGGCDLVTEFAMPVCGEALKAITGLTEMPAHEMDRVSQHMIDGCANYAGDAEIEARCHAATAYIDEHIDRMAPKLRTAPDTSALSVQLAAGLPMDATRANIKLVISGGQNEPRDAIAGTVWALLEHPEQLRKIQTGDVGYLEAFEEYARFMSPIGMSPRQVARSEHVLGHDFEIGERVFLMFGAANRDPRVFDAPETFDITRDTRKSVTFGAGPHFCAGAAASRSLVAEVALPSLFARFPKLRLNGAVSFGGWAFRGPLSVPVAWD